MSRRELSQLSWTAAPKGNRLNATHMSASLREQPPATAGVTRIVLMSMRLNPYPCLAFDNLAKFGPPLRVGALRFDKPPVFERAAVDCAPELSSPHSQFRRIERTP